MRPHGTPSQYNMGGCRCDVCRKAWNAYTLPYQEAYRRRKGMKPQKIGRTCGLIGTYNKGCRCDDCRRAARDAKRRQRAKAYV